MLNLRRIKKCESRAIYPTTDLKPREGVARHHAPVLAPPVGLTTGQYFKAELDALTSLELILGGARFWNPDTLYGIAPEALEALITTVVGRSPKMLKQMERARASREHPLSDRIDSLHEALVAVAGRDSERRHRVLAWTAGVPLELSVKDAGGGCSFLGSNKLCWLPEDLQQVEDLFVYGAQITRLPPDLKVARVLDIRYTMIDHLPKGLTVGQRLFLGGSPLARFSDTELRIMAPGVSGEIIR